MVRGFEAHSEYTDFSKENVMSRDGAVSENRDTNTQTYRTQSHTSSLDKKEHTFPDKLRSTLRSKQPPPFKIKALVSQFETVAPTL